jgi:hypothetical protein
MSNRVSGLSDDHAAHARSLIVLQARTMVAHKGEIHYTQKYPRQEGLRNHLTITKGQFPKHADCSSTAYWMLWDAIHRNYGVRDLVCHVDWNPNGLIYTGSQYKHGKRVVHDSNLKIGDLIFYGDQGGGIPEHVAVYVGGGKVFSNGSEGGPYILDIDYRGDRRRDCMRRFI